LAVIPLPQVLHELDDTAAVLGRDAKRLRDSTVDAISDVRVEAQSTSVRLAQEVREGNSSLLEGLNASFKADDDRIRMVPTVATLAPDGSAPRIPFFSGTTDELQLSA
uniref:Methyl-accepting chemotaxis protein n=1 Tax=Heligmosomoides polygyrus TaxID=6339 RepID=A0A183FCT7_HELPZ